MSMGENQSIVSLCVIMQRKLKGPKNSEVTFSGEEGTRRGTSLSLFFPIFLFFFFLPVFFFFVVVVQCLRLYFSSQNHHHVEFHNGFYIHHVEFLSK